MLKEKINGLLTGNGNNKKKIENLVFLLVILIITVISINVIWNGDKKKEDDTSTESNTKQLAKNNNDTDNETTLESKLENILSKINGVGKADVMLTYTESTQMVPVYNKTEKTSNTDESDSGGGTRKIEESDVSQEVVYEDEKKLVLVIGHAYSITNLYEFELPNNDPNPAHKNQTKEKQYLRLIQLRNPWSYYEWLGNFHDKSDKWNIIPNLRQKVGLINKDDGL